MAAGRRSFRPMGRLATHVLTGCVLLGCVLAFGIGTARAQIGSDRYSSIIIDANSGRVLSSAAPDEQRHPASLTKMMTLYMVFEALRDRRISLNALVPVSAHAASMSPSKLGLLPATRITVEEAILGLVTKSANDAASALGEMLGGGDEDRFAQMMTLRARALGMSRTVFRNASGLPDPEQWTTARDMAVLGRHLIHDFPREYHYFSTPSFRFHGRTIYGHDHMLQNYAGTDGIKTGYTEASGFNLVTSAVRSDVRLIGVVLGAAHSGERDLHMATLLNQGFEQMDVAPQPRRPAGNGGALIASAKAAPMPGPTRPLPAPSLAAPSLATNAARAAKWSIQVGAFASEAAARQAAAAARRLAGFGDARVEAITQRRKTSWRAQVIGLTEPEARGTCANMTKHKQPCALLPPDHNQMASG